MKIGIILPTRGLVFTRVEEEIEKLRKQYDIEVYRSNSLPIPEGHNHLTEKALGDGKEVLFFIEEDTVPPAGALEKMLAVTKDADIACIDYGVAGWGCVARDTKGEILWCGLGCTVIKRQVFEALERPYFRTDMVLRLNDWTWQKLSEEYVKTKQYGGLDIWFCTKAKELGFKIGQVPEEEADHLRLVELGKREINNGLHKIELKPKIEKRQIIGGQ